MLTQSPAHSLTPELPLYETAPNDPNLKNLIALLQRERTWLLASDILRAWACDDTEAHRRWLRKLAETAQPEIISGQQGYKHIEHASPEEVHHFCAAMESQAKKMAERVAAVRRRAHQQIG